MKEAKNEQTEKKEKTENQDAIGKKDRFKRTVNTILFVVAIAVFLVSAVKLAGIAWNYYSSDKEYKSLQSYVKDNSKNGIQSTTDNAKSDTQTMSQGEFTVDFAGLKKENPDCVGWIRFPGLDINYPVMHGTDNDYYLKHTFDGSVLTAASIFTDCGNKPDFSDDNTFIYGHNMKNKSMFGRLNDYKDESFYKDHLGFYIYTPEYTYYYTIFSCYLAAVEGEADSFNISFPSSEQYAAYQKTVKARSTYDTGVTVDGSKKMVTLMTCNKAGYDYRFLVHAIQTEAIPVK